MAESLADEAARLGPWFHNLHLPDGGQTRPDHLFGDFPMVKWRCCADWLPVDLTGKTVLDIGVNGGFYALECARRGATVVGVDIDPRYLRQARWASEVFGLADRIRLVEAQVYDLARWEAKFDIVLFLGVFYHLRYPLLGLDIVASRAKGTLLFQSLTMPGPAAGAVVEDGGLDGLERLAAADWPHLAFIEGAWAGDPSNWWVPDPAAVDAMLRSAGFEVQRAAGDMRLAMRVPGAAVTESWDRSEYESVLGLDWRRSARDKVRPKAGTLEAPT